MFTANGKHEFVPHDKVFPLLVLHVHFFFTSTKNSKYFHDIFIHKNCFRLLLPAHFVFEKLPT